MPINFSKQVPDELYVDSFTSNNSLELTYSGPDVIKVLVDRENGYVGGFVETNDDPHNGDMYMIVDIVAADEPAVAYFFDRTLQGPVEIEHVTETLPGGLTFDAIANPTLRNYYEVAYDLEENEWIWKVVVREKKSILNHTADRYREYINDNIDTLTGAVKTAATSYLTTLDTFETAGKGSIPSWKLVELSARDVPIPPANVITAIGFLPQ